MPDTIILEILEREYRAEYVGECLRLIDVAGDKDGYPKARRGDKHIRLHRGVLGLTDPKVFACHTCDNPFCVNIDHLYAGNAQTNMRDKCDRGRYRGNGFRLPEWKRNLYFELEQAYGPNNAAKCLGLKSGHAVGKHRKTFFRPSEPG